MDLASLMKSLSVNDDYNHTHHKIDINGVGTLFLFVRSPRTEVFIVTQDPEIGPAFTAELVVTDAENGTSRRAYKLYNTHKKTSPAGPTVQFLLNQLDLGKKVVTYVNLTEYSEDTIQKILTELKKYYQK